MKKFFLPACCLLAGAALVSCSNDNVTYETQPEIGGETGYLSFKIQSSEAGTRAGDTNGSDGGADGAWLTDRFDEYFNEGIVNEYQVTKDSKYNRAFFFDANGNYHSYSGLTYESDLEFNPNEKTYSFMAMVSKRGANSSDWPSYAIVVLNGNSVVMEQLASSRVPMDEFLRYPLENPSHEAFNTSYIELALSDKDDDNAPYFTMTNSAYLDDYANGDFSGRGKMKTATELLESNFYLTPEEAAQNAVTVFVERIMSKVQVLFGDKATKTDLGYMFTINDESNPDAPTLRALITGWGLTGTSYNAYLVKNFSIVPYSGDYASNIIDLSNGSTNVFEKWNDLYRHRSYWGIDLFYADDMSYYPTQYRHAYSDNSHTANATSFDDNTDWVLGNLTPGTNGQWHLGYNSYNYIQSKFNLSQDYLYALPNTHSNTTVYSPYTHLVLNSILLNEGENLNSLADINNIADKFRVNGEYFNEADFLNESVATFVSTLLKLPQTQVKNVETEEMFSFPANSAAGISGELYANDTQLSSNGKVVSPLDLNQFFTIAPAYLVGGDGKAILGLKPGVKLYYTLEGDNTKYEISATEALSLIYNYSLRADHFKNGRMYYALPVAHHGVSHNKTFEHVGDFGMVRNHWYIFNIDSVLKPGVSVNEPNQPIIPNYDEEDRYLGLQIVIIPWHVVTNDNVQLK